MGFATLDQIVGAGYCLSCGLCTGVARDGAITMEITEDDQLRPVAARALTDAENARIVALCPGVTHHGPEAFDDPVWGALRGSYEGWATDPDTRFRASAGGVMTALNRFLLEGGRADFILQVRAAGGMHSEPVMVRDPLELLSGSQSRYAPVAPLAMTKAALATGERFGVSLKPCDIAGLANLARHDPRVARQVVFTQAMFCGTTPAFETSRAFLARKGATGEPRRFRWRGDGCPGPTVAEMDDGREIRGDYNAMWIDARWTTQFRCKICPDAVGLMADVATGDIWPGGVPKGESAGENAIIAHTARGAEVLAAARAAGLLELRETGPDRIAGTQPHHVRLRQTFADRVRAATDAGLPAPDFSGLAAEECAAQLPKGEHDRTYAGTRTRLSGDRNIEFDPQSA